MIEAYVYVTIAIGVYSKTERFWASFGWPYELGRMLGTALVARGNPQ